MGGDVDYRPDGRLGADAFWFDEGTAWVPSGRTSLIVDPPDGRIPYTPTARDGERPYGSGPWDSHLHLDTGERCSGDGLPQIWFGDNPNHQILQTPTDVVIVHEMYRQRRGVEHADVGSGVGTRGTPDGALIDDDHIAVSSAPGRSLPEGVDELGDQRALARPGHAGDARQHALRYPDAEVAQVVGRCVLNTEQGEIPCPECERQMPAGCGKRCWDCYWQQVAQHRIRVNAAGLVSPTLAQRFADFGAWLIDKTGARKTALNIKRYLEFFQQIEKQWDDIPRYDALLDHFGAAGLRRRLLAVRWMEAAGLVVIDADRREADSERRRIKEALNRLPAGSQGAIILAGYHATLRVRTRAGKCTLRSVRLALSPAAGLLKMAAARGLPPDQRTLEAFLRQSPGQQAALSSFVTYLRRTYGTELALPRRSALQRQKERRAKLLPELLAVMREVDRIEGVDRRWLRIGLQYFHDLPARAGKNAADDDVSTDAEGITVRVKNRSYWIPWPRAAAASTTSPDPDAAEELDGNSARDYSA